MVFSTFYKQHKIPLLYAFLSVVFYISFAYDLHRTDSIKLLSLYFGLFFLFYKLITSYGSSLKFLMVIAILFRLVFLFAIPNLSQDFYRFIWDGRMILEGLNPYLYTPESFIVQGEFPLAQAQELYDGMGALSASHYTNYPPLKQFVFFIAGLFSGNSILGAVLVFRGIIIVADIGTLYFGKRLLERLKLPTYHIFWYLLNPFIIIELTGNLHFEGLMIFFLVLSLYLLHLNRWETAAVSFACSISVKLIPLVLLPLFFTYFTGTNGFNRTKNTVQNTKTPTHGILPLLGFYTLVGGVTLALFAPFYSLQFVTNYSQTVGLWFRDFEFNASLYYIARKIGYKLTGYNQIGIIGQFIPIITIITVALLTFFRKNAHIIELMANMLLALTVYYFVSTTVHPWYLATLLIWSVFTGYKYPIVWSCVVILSYLAYGNAQNVENLWIIGLEYTIVYLVFIREVLLKKTGKT